MGMRAPNTRQGFAPGGMPSAPLTPPAIPNPYTGPTPFEAPMSPGAFGKPFQGVGPGPMPAGAYQDPLSMMRGREGLPQQYGNYRQALQALIQMMGAQGQQPAAPGVIPSAPVMPGTPVAATPLMTPRAAPAPPLGGMRNVRTRPTGWRRKA